VLTIAKLSTKTTRVNGYFFMMMKILTQEQIMKCLICQVELEITSSRLYARCPKCRSLFMNVAGVWQLYPVEESQRSLIEHSLGFSSTTAADINAA
jgi:hypothetical protein